HKARAASWCKSSGKAAPPCRASRHAKTGDPRGPPSSEMCGRCGLLVLFFVQAVQQIPDAQHVLGAQRTVILAVAGAAAAGAFLPQLAAVVGADVPFKAAVVVGAQDLDDAGLAAAVAVGRFTKVAVGEVVDVADVGEGDAVAVL